MNGNRSENINIEQITSGISMNTFILKIIDYVYEQLPAWRDDSDRPDVQPENNLNLQLCKFLNSQAKNAFPMVRFNTEEPQPGQRRVDLSTSPVERITFEARSYTIYDPILVLEGKRLPAPSRDREREYVTGFENKKGGIQRFKLGLHGAEHAIAVMIGYIQEDSPYDWFDRINHWISELADGSFEDLCVWDTSETLRLFEENEPAGVSRYQSVHSRSGSNISDRITLRHLWIIMNIQQLPKGHD